MPVIGFLHSQTPDALAERLRGLRRGLKDAGYVEARWAENTSRRAREAAMAAFAMSWRQG
jgi:hypothetical protein